jgi:tetratricopeptide (TPR) repeat protein
MTDGHCFISYSAVDGLDFATKLADELQGRHPNIHVWFDKHEMDASIVDWDDQLANAIKACKCLVFVMTPDSVAKGSTCKEEWTWALKYKKPVICLVKDKKAEVPFRLNNRQYIDIATDFESGIAQLRTAIKRLDEPEGILEELDRRVSQAKRDLQRTPHEEEKPRIQAEIEELNKQIEAQQKIVADPKAAEEQTQINIKTGLERERQPKEPVASKTSTKFINPPPGIAPNYFQDRLIETKQVVEFFKDNSQRLMTIVGRGGVGKTAMVCRLLKGIESGILPDDLGEMKASGIVYLSEAGSHRVNFTNIFYDLCKLLENNIAQELDKVYKNPQASTESKMRALLDRFTDGKVILLLDNIEPLINVETFNIGDAELDESLCAFLHGAHSAVKIIATTRIAPRGLNLCEPGRQRIYHLEEGLPSPYAEKMLRELDFDGTLGLKDAKEEDLNCARIKTRGFPKGLEAFKQILASDRYTTLEELLAMPTPENVVEALVGEAFNRLDTNAQKVMQALAVYNRPVTPAAVDYLLAPHLPAIDSAPILQRLANMHFARKESGRFYLHPVDREFAFGLIPEKDSNTKGTKEEQRKLLQSFYSKRQFSFPNYHLLFTQHDLTLRAADYFAAARKPRAEWKKLDNLAAQLAEFDLRCAAGDYDTAASVLGEFDGEYLFLWGHYRLIIDLHDRLQGKIKDLILKMFSLIMLGSANAYIGRVDNAIRCQEQALSIAREKKDKRNESVLICNLGNRYAELGNTDKAIEFYKQALVIDRETGFRKGEGADLVNLGNCYADLGDIHQAIEYCEQALAIAREAGDKQTECALLANIGNRFMDLGNADKAVEYYNQALVIAHEFGNRRYELQILENFGHANLNLEEYKKAQSNYQQAIQIADEISFPLTQRIGRWGLAQIHLFQNDLVNARTTIEAALQYDVPQYNHNATALHGIIALRQGERETAQEAFTKSIAQADEILAKTPDYYSALDAKGLAVCGLASCRGDPSMPAETIAGKTVPPDKSTVSDGRVAPTINDAIETFRKALKIAPHAGVVKSVLRLFDELVKCDEEGVLKGVREVIARS